MPASDHLDRSLTDLARRYVGLAFLVSGDRDLALDVVADVTLRIIERGSEPHIDNLDAFFRRSVVNRAIDLGRRRARAFRGVTDWTCDEDAGDIADAAIAVVMVGQALKRISPKLRAVVVLRYYDDLSEREIAEVLAIPVGTVKSRMSRALAQLEQSLTGEHIRQSGEDPR